MSKTSNEKQSKPSTLKIWVTAARPHTLTASIAPVLVGHQAVYGWILKQSQKDNAPVEISTLYLSITFAAFACLVQLGTNLHNDYADFIKGADTDKRVGQARATQMGWLTPRQTARGATLCLGFAFALGLHLSHLVTIYSPTSTGPSFDGVMLFITLSSVFNAVAYTGGPYPLGYIGLGHISIGYAGLGDLFVFLYFGLVATMTVPYLHLRSISSSSSSLHLIQHHPLMHLSFHLALPIGFLATAIIVVNNLRDRMTDVLARKMTLAVRFGEYFARGEYTFLVLGSYLLLLPLVLFHSVSWIVVLLPFLSLPVAIPQLKAVGFGGKDGRALNEHVGGTARVQLLFCITLALAIRNL